MVTALTTHKEKTADKRDKQKKRIPLITKLLKVTVCGVYLGFPSTGTVVFSM